MTDPDYKSKLNFLRDDEANGGGEQLVVCKKSTTCISVDCFPQLAGRSFLDLYASTYGTNNYNYRYKVFDSYLTISHLQLGCIHIHTVRVWVSVCAVRVIVNMTLHVFKYNLHSYGLFLRGSSS